MSLDQYQSYIHISRYARWDEDKGRRETWGETVDRWCTFFDNRFEKAHSDYIWNVIRPAIFNLEVMPSMRALMTAGPALERENLAGYNCAYLAVNNKRSFSETLYVLMCGTGVGFSCERQEVNKLPEVPEKFSPSDDTIVVEDSKEGWAKAYRKLVSSLYEGDIPNIDYSKVRPAGARLKTFGGRASGPEPLKRLFTFTTNVFRKAAGRKLQSIEVHDIMCMIGDVVVVGGVRRSALISLSNLSDMRMRDAKSGDWRQVTPWRELSNNSATYTEKPSASVFLEEWVSLIKSYSGERGIFNREAAQKQASRWGRRSADLSYGCNPCCFTGETKVSVPGDEHAITIKDLAEYSGGVKKFLVYSAAFTEQGYWTPQVKSAIARDTGEKLVHEVVLSDGSTFRSTDDHLLAKKAGGYVMVKDSIGVSLQAIMPGSDVSVVSVTELGIEKIYDLQVEDNENFYIVTKSSKAPRETSLGILVHNSEIILRDKQLCNLSEVIIRQHDTLDDLKRKIEIATVIGTFQATLTNFKFVSDSWKKNTEEERLLGVSLTGIFDNRLTSGLEGVTVLRNALKELRDHARVVNKEWADKLDIPESAAITCVKPSGTVSQLCDTASGIHPRWSRFYIRTCRLDKKDPVYRLMKDRGFYMEDAMMKEETTAVGYFPTEAPAFGVTREKLTALEHLKMWLIYQQDWCEHKPSVTINVKESEWPEVAGWVYNHFDEISGIAFLPYDDHVYPQAPYNEVTEEEYMKWIEAHPTPSVDWLDLAKYEQEDNTVSMQTLACVGNNCDWQPPTA